MSRERIEFAIGASTAGQITDSYTAAIRVRGDVVGASLDVGATDFSARCRLYRVELEFTAVAGGLTTGDIISVKAAWTSTENARNCTNIGTSEFQVASGGLTGSAVLTFNGERMAWPDDGTIGSLYLFVKHNRVGATATCTARVTHVSEVGQ